MSTPSERKILQRELARWIVADVFNTISADDIVREEKNQVTGESVWMHHGAPLSDGQVAVLKKEAAQFAKMSLCRVLMDELHYHARTKLELAKTEEDIVSAKLLSYLVKIVQEKVQKIAGLKA